MKKLETLQFKHFCMSIGNLPSSYVESLSYYECLLWLINYLQKEVIPTVNNNAEAVTELQNLFTQLQDYVANYFDNLDVQEEINNKLDDMVEDGSLNSILAKYLKTQSNMIIPEYAMTRYIKVSENYTSADNTIPHEIEGLTYIDNNRVIAIYSPTGSGIGESSDCLIEEYDLSNKTHPDVVRSLTVTGLMHGNSCAYDSKNNKLYVALWGYYSGGTVPVSKVAIVNYTTLAIESVVDISGITQLGKVAYYNEKLYGLDSSNNVYELDLVNGTSTLLYQVTSVYGGGSQGFIIKDNIIYINYSNPSLIVMYDFTDGSYIKSLSINEYTNVGHQIGAYQSDITFINDDTILIACHKGCERLSTSNLETSYMANYLCKINIYGAGLGNTTINEFFTKNNIYINQSNIETTYYATGSEQYPIKLLDEYLHHYYKKLDNSRLIGTGLSYFGTLILRNESLEVESSLTVYGLNMNNATLDVQGLTVNTNNIYLRGARLISSNITLNYEGDSKHEIQYSVVNAPQFSTTAGIINRSSYISGNKSNKFYYYNNTSLAILPSTITIVENVATVDFSSNVTNTNFNPSDYILCIGLSSGENIMFPKTQGLGNNRRFYDASGNEYIVTTYSKNSKSLTITSDSISNLTVVTMITI